LYLDRKGGLIFVEDVSIGSLHSAIVHPREVFKTAVKRSAVRSFWSIISQRGSCSQ
jgi:DNA repair protein RadC